MTALAVFAGDSGQLKTGFTFLSTKSLPFCQPNVPLCHLLSAKSPLWKKKLGGKLERKLEKKSGEKVGKVGPYRRKVKKNNFLAELDHSEKINFLKKKILYFLTPPPIQRTNFFDPQSKSESCWS